MDPKIVILFTAKEMDPFYAMAINARFNSFLAKFCAVEGLDFNSARTHAAQILREAEIPQPGDNLTEGCSPIDLTPFMEQNG